MKKIFLGSALIVLFASACSGQSAQVNPTNPSLDSQSQRPVESLNGRAQTRIDYAKNSTKLESLSGMDQMSRRSRALGITPQKSVTMLYHAFLATGKIGTRDDVDLSRVVQVDSIDIVSPTTLQSGTVFTGGIETVVSDAQTGDLLTVIMNGPATRPPSNIQPSAN